MKDRDLELALAIAGFGGQPTRDARGNVLATVWSKCYDHSQVGLLLERNDVRALLLKQLETQIRDRKALIEELDTNDVVCKWILDFTNSWERAYTDMKKAEYDIAQQVLSAMHETFYMVEPFLEKYTRIEALRPSKIRERINGLSTKYQHAVPDAEARKGLLLLHAGTDACARALFRSKVGLDLCRIAGKVLQKSEVCNRAGAYSSRVQRNDIQREVEFALDHVCRLLLERDPLLDAVAAQLSDDDTLATLAADHRGYPKQSNVAA